MKRSSLALILIEGSLLAFVLQCAFMAGAFAQKTETILPRPVRDNFTPFVARVRRPVMHHPKIGLVLSGGGARALAQIGVLRELERNNIPVDLIVGTSLGSVIGGLYASGYSVAQIESIATHADWDRLLSFSDASRRSDVFVGQKEDNEEGFLSLRFDGVEPIYPSSISSGQQLTDYFMSLTMQALYHPDSSFDNLRIPFRCIATDLLTGKRVILDHGSLAEAMRSSITVPFLYAPLERDSMELVDGGLLSNIPVDVARSMGCDIVIAVNSTSTLNRAAQLGAPWEVADQIMSIMMQAANQAQLKNADVVMTPDLGNRSVANFADVDTLEAAGEAAADGQMAGLLAAVHRSDSTVEALSSSPFGAVALRFTGDTLPPALERELSVAMVSGTLSRASIQDVLTRTMETRNYMAAKAVVTREGDTSLVGIEAKMNPVIREIQLSGCNVIPPDTIHALLGRLIGHPLNRAAVHEAFEEILRRYRDRKFSLARFDSTRFDTLAGVLHVKIDEGIIAGLRYKGNLRTRDYVIRREFPLDRPDVFDLNKANEGLINIMSTGIFEYVLMEVQYEGGHPWIVLNVKEKPDEVLRLGLHADNEHGIVSTLSLRDVDFRGAGENVGLSLRYGYRDRFAKLSYTADRIFQTYFTFNVDAHYLSRDIIAYTDDANEPQFKWQRIEDGRYRQIKAGGSLSFGSQVERLGNVTATMRWDYEELDSLSGIGYDTSIGTNNAFAYTRVAALRLQSIIDTEDKFSFPTDGLYFKLYYETAEKDFGGSVSYTKFGANYESYTTFLDRNTIHPKVTFGYADQTLPLPEQFSLGGFDSFLGLNEDDSRGRQIFLVNFEDRYFLPFRLVWDSYLSARYDLGTITPTAGDLKFDTFRHGFGLILGLDTPIGPAGFGGGVSFHFTRNLPNQPLSYGPVTFYFSIGPSL